MATNQERAVDVNALWARAQELLPGLRCKVCGGKGTHISGLLRDAVCPDGYITVRCGACGGRPDLALLLNAMREAGWLYALMPASAGAYCWFKRDWLSPRNDAYAPDELTAALLAAVKTLEGGSHDRA